MFQDRSRWSFFPKGDRRMARHKTKTTKVEENGAQNRIAGLVDKDGKVTGEKGKLLQIKPLHQEVLAVRIEGLAPLVMNRFSNKARQKMHDTQEAGSQATKKRTREPKD